VLKKTPKGRDVHNTDTFTANLAFWDQKFRIKINQIQLKETKEENKATHERVAQDRRYETQAAIVRIMKSRKTLTHQQLMAEVIDQTKNRGAVEPTEIKKNIERYRCLTKYACFALISLLVSLRKSTLSETVHPIIT
jgi:cullin-4